MIRFFTAAIAAAVLTTGAVASLAAAPNQDKAQVTIAKNGDYCVRGPVVTGELVAPSECRSVSEWAKDGVTFSRR